jgi:hypothetical protein
MAGIVAYRNLGNDTDVITAAARNQFLHSFISAYTLILLYDILAKWRKDKPGQDVVPIVVPAALTTIACYLMHRYGFPPLELSPSIDPGLNTAPTLGVISAVMPLYHYRDRVMALFNSLWDSWR